MIRAKLFLGEFASNSTRSCRATNARLANESSTSYGKYLFSPPLKSTKSLGLTYSHTIMKYIQYRSPNVAMGVKGGEANNCEMLK